MRAQLEALIDATKMPNVRLQIIPFEYGGHAAAGGSFSILRFPDQDLPDIVYVEQLDSALYFDKREDVDITPQPWSASRSRPIRRLTPPRDSTVPCRTQRSDRLRRVPRGAVSDRRNHGFSSSPVCVAARVNPSPTSKELPDGAGLPVLTHRHLRRACSARLRLLAWRQGQPCR